MARNGDEHVPGYALLGKLMWEHSDTAIFRSFGAFSAENLLYLQAELVGLENELRYAQKADQGSPHPERQRYAVNWVGLSQSAGEDACERDDGTQWQIVLEMRSKLKEYQEALLRHRDIAKLAKPGRSSLQSLQEWMRRTSMGDVRLVGADKDIWSKPDYGDLVCVDESEAWTTRQLILLYHRYIGKHIHKSDESRRHLRNAIAYDNIVIERVGKMLMGVAGGLLPVISIVVLYTVKDMATRLGILALLTTVFSLCLTVATKADVTQVFGASAAFAAVLVVFVGASG